jgi:hypothetical protein
MKIDIVGVGWVGSSVAISTLHPVWAGVGAVAIGGVILLLGSKKNYPPHTEQLFVRRDDLVT